MALFNGFSIICLLEILAELSNWLLPSRLKFICTQEGGYSPMAMTYLNCTTVHGLPYLKHIM